MSGVCISKQVDRLILTNCSEIYHRQRQPVKPIIHLAKTSDPNIVVELLVNVYKVSFLDG